MLDTLFILEYFKNEAWPEKESILCLKIYKYNIIYVFITKRQEHC